MATQKATSKKFRASITIIGIIAIIVLMAIPFVIIQDSQFGGSDGVGSEVIATIAPDYDSSWISNIWKPPGSETESMLFALQATAGGILIGYFFGYFNGLKKGRSESVE